MPENILKACVSCGEAELILSPSLSDQVVTKKLETGATLEINGFNGPFACVTSVNSGNTGYLFDGHIELVEKYSDKTHYIKIFSEIYSYTDMLKDIKRLVRKHKNIVEYKTIGKTLCGRDISAIKIGSGKLNLLVHASIHGREYITTAVLMKQIEQLLENEKHVKELLQHISLHIIPMVNPDGVMISQRGLESINSDEIRKKVTDLAAYKNHDKNSALCLWKGNANGVDLNSNFDYGFQSFCMLPYHYNGEYPVSEPETRALVDYTKKNNINYSISYHATSSEIIWDIGQNGRLREKTYQFAKVASASTGYTLSEIDDYSTSGGYKDWMIGVNGVPSITLEMGALPCPNPLGEYQMVWHRNKNLLVDILKYLSKLKS